jgi:hypothetical protein
LSKISLTTGDGMMITTPVDIDDKELKAIISSLVKIYQWEMGSADFFHNVTARHLYFNISQRAIVEQSLTTKSMKDIYHGSEHFTEKGIRIRLREFEENGHLETFPCANDARVKYIKPSEKTMRFIYSHAQYTKKILLENFILVRKQ